MKKFLLAALLAGYFVSSYGQTNLSDINFDRIPFKKVRHYIKSQILQNVKSTDDLVPSYAKEITPDSCYKQVCTYVLPCSMEDSWNVYTTVKPNNAWNGRKVRLGMLVDKIKQTIVYPGDICDIIDTGQVVYLNLRVLEGVTNVGVAFEVINIDKQAHMLEFSYLKGNKSLGKQQLHFSENPDGTTHLVHVSYFKSNSKFRDKFLYPYFHKRFTNEFHRNMAQSLESKELNEFNNLTYLPN